MGEADDKKDADVIGNLFVALGNFCGVVFTRIFRMLFQLWDTKAGRAVLGGILISLLGAAMTGWANLTHGTHAGKRMDTLELRVDHYHHLDSVWHRDDSTKLVNILTAVNKLGGKSPARLAVKPKPAAARDTSGDHRTAQNLPGGGRTF